MYMYIFLQGGDCRIMSIQCPRRGIAKSKWPSCSSTVSYIDTSTPCECASILSIDKNHISLYKNHILVNKINILDDVGQKKDIGQKADIPQQKKGAAGDPCMRGASTGVCVVLSDAAQTFFCIDSLDIEKLT